MRRSQSIAVAALTLVTAALIPAHAEAEDARTGAGQAGYSEAGSAARPSSRRQSIGISGNPAAIEDTTGTGWLGRQLGLKDGWELGGVYNSAGNYLMSGGLDPGTTFNSQLIVNLRVDLERTHGLKGSAVGVQFMQLNSGTTNDDAGTELGYNAIGGVPPLHRSELVQAWWRQKMFDDRFVLRVGKSNPNGDFANVVRPVLTTARPRDIGVVSSLLFGPLYTPATMFNTFPGFYETAYGITGSWVPNKEIYAAYAVFDGNQARGVTTGLELLPEFNGYYYHIAEVGRNWLWGPEDKPGSIAVGGWKQTGELTGEDGATENGATGYYVIGSQQIWYRDPEPIDNAGISAFFQVGWADTKTLPYEYYVGGGLTFRGLVRSRPKDSFGAGIAWGRSPLEVSETIYQGYYQAQVTGPIYTATYLSYIPDPSAEPGIPPAWAITQQLSIPF